MGVQGLWQLLHSAGKPISPASLEGKVLAVGIWLHQTMKGMRDKDGNPLPNAHLQGLFSRICKLLFYRIRPVFVFDGGVPALKKQTLAARRERKDNLEREKGRTTQKLLQNLLQDHAVKGITGDRTKHINVPFKPNAEPDMFQLPPIPEIDKGSLDPVENAAIWETEDDLREDHRSFIPSVQANHFQNLEEIDFESEEFRSLPAEIRHEILSEMKEQRKENALARIAIMPEETKEFSNYQLQKLIKQSQLTGKIESVRKEMNRKISGDITYALGDNYYGEVVEAQRVISEDAAHYILIKGLTRKQQMAEAERCAVRHRAREGNECEPKPADSRTSPGLKKQWTEDEESVSTAKEDETRESKVENQVLSDGEVTDEDAERKKRQKRRGKSLMTRTGVRSVAKRVKAKHAVNKNFSDDEDSADASSCQMLTLSDAVVKKLKSELCEQNAASGFVSKAPDSKTCSLHLQESKNGVNLDNLSFHYKVESAFSAQTKEARINCEEIGSNRHSADRQNETKFKKAETESLTEQAEIIDSHQIERTLSREDSFTQDTIDSLILLEEDLQKEKEKKMASLLKSVEKRSQSLSQTSQLPVTTDKGRPDTKEKAGKSSCVSPRFLESATGRERQTFQWTNQAAATITSESLSSAPSSLKPFPALTVEYLENIETMTDVNQHVGENSQAQSDNETDVNVSAAVKSPLQPCMAATIIKHTKVPCQEFSQTKKPMKSIDKTKSIISSGNQRKIGVEEHSSAAAASSCRAAKRVEPEEEDSKKTRSAQPPAGWQPEKREESEDEGFIEITIDPSKVPNDDLFPASIFTTEPITVAVSSQPNGDLSPQDIHMSSSHNCEEDDKLNVKADDSEVMEIEAEEKSEDGGDMGDGCLESRFEQRNCNLESLEDRHDGQETNDSSGRGKKTASEEQTTDKDSNNFAKGINTLSDLYGLQKDLVSERQTLTSERGRQTRLGKSVTEQTNLEAQELLRLFGVPYVVSPGEAESQCVCLELLGLTQGTITDDSDAWLFGACKVYKNFFNQTKYVEFFSADTIYQSFGLDRHKLINLALLCGSDYTPGIPGVGPVRAMEVLAEFPGEGLDSLKAFREWWEDAKNGLLPRNLGKAKNKLRTLQLHEGFPSQQVVDAYLHPAVDESEETFTWGVPDLNLLRQKKFGWERQKSDSILEPMMKELTKKMTQGRIHSYFHPENFLPPKQVQSKRLQKALDKFQGRQSSESESISESGSESASESESTGSEPALSKPDESVMKKANQILSGSPGCKGQKVTSRGACRGKKRGKADGPGSSDRQVTEDKVFEPEFFKPGESVIKKANQILSGTPGIKGKKTDGKGNSQGKRGGKSYGQKPPNRRGAADVYGKGSKPTRIIKQGLLKDELCLSESSSSSDEVSDAFKTKKMKVLPEQRVTKPHQLPQQKSKSSGPMSLGTKKKPKTTPNVKKITPAIPKPPHKIKSKGNVKGAVINTAVENIAAFKEAMGGSLDPTEMTIDDLGSDFSDND